MTELWLSIPGIGTVGFWVRYLSIPMVKWSIKPNRQTQAFLQAAVYRQCFREVWQLPAAMPIAGQAKMTPALIIIACTVHMFSSWLSLYPCRIPGPNTSKRSATASWLKLKTPNNWRIYYLMIMQPTLVMEIISKTFKIHPLIHWINPTVCGSIDHGLKESRTTDEGGHSCFKWLQLISYIHIFNILRWVIVSNHSPWVYIASVI